jgi:hypothetical protein
MRPMPPFAVLVASLFLSGVCACAPVAAAPPLDNAMPARDGLDAQWMPSSDERTVLQRLSAREAMPCAEVIDGIAEPVAALRFVIAHAPKGPPPIRAARCLVREHLGAIESDAERWLREPGTKGLATVVVDAIDTMPEESAGRLARVALDGPYADTLRPRLAQSTRQSVLQLVRESTPELSR